MGLFRLVARVGCLRGGAIRLLEEWSHIRRRQGRRRTEPGLQTLWHFFRGSRGGPARAEPLSRPAWRSRRDRMTGDFRAGAAMARSARRRRCACCDRHGCDEPGDRPAPKAPNKPDRWYFCERHAAEYNRNWNYFEGLTRRGSGGARGRRAARRQRLSPMPNIMAGAAPATAAAAATRCARSKCSRSRSTPISRRSRPPIAGSPRPTIPTSRRATPRPPSASRRSRRPMTCCARPRSAAAPSCQALRAW